MSDVYDVLGVARDAGPAQIKSAYRRLAKVYHPDVRGGDGRAERRFKEIARAYETLSRPEIRAAYDAGWASARAVARRRVRDSQYSARLSGAGTAGPDRGADPEACGPGAGTGWSAG